MINNIFHGIDAETYAKLLPELKSMNRKVLIMMSSATTILLTILLVVTSLTDIMGFARNIYLAADAFYITVLLLSICAKNKLQMIIMPLSVLFIIFSLLFGVCLSILDSPDHVSTVYMVLLIVVPLLFNLRPITPAIAVILCTITLIVLEYFYKTRDVFFTDIINAFSIGSMGIFVGTYMMRIKLARYKIGIVNKEQAEAQLQKAGEQLLSQTEILKTISGIYNSLHMIDLEKDTVFAYSSNEIIDKYVTTGNNVEEKMKAVMTHLFIEEQRDFILEFTDLKTLPQRLMNTKYTTHDFKSTRIGWLRLTFIVNKRNEQGVPTQVLFTTLLIDADKTREEDLYKQSKTDELTGLSNRRAYEEKLLEHKNNVIPEDLTVFAFDVNRLKQVNDTMGHAAGDELITGAADCILQVCRNYGPCYRTGGDEFMALLKADAETALQIKLDFLKITANWKGKLVEEMSIACGYATKSEHPVEDVLELAKLADKNMYMDKRDFYISSGIERRRIDIE